MASPRQCWKESLAALMPSWVRFSSFLRKEPISTILLGLKDISGLFLVKASLEAHQDLSPISRFSFHVTPREAFLAQEPETLLGSLLLLALLSLSCCLFVSLSVSGQAQKATGTLP